MVSDDWLWITTTIIADLGEEQKLMADNGRQHLTMAEKNPFLPLPSFFAQNIEAQSCFNRGTAQTWPRSRSDFQAVRASCLCISSRVDVFTSLAATGCIDETMFGCGSRLRSVFFSFGVCVNPSSLLVLSLLPCLSVCLLAPHFFASPPLLASWVLEMDSVASQTRLVSYLETPLF